MSQVELSCALPHPSVSACLASAWIWGRWASSCSFTMKVSFHHSENGSTDLKGIEGHRAHANTRVIHSGSKVQDKTRGF